MKETARIRGGALSIGAGAFALFWDLAPTALNDELPWMVTLAIHGVSLVSLVTGLILLMRDFRVLSAGTLIARMGLIIAVVGLLTVFPLIPVGFLLLAVGLLLVRVHRVAAFILGVGSVALLLSVVAGARVGMEDAPTLSGAATAWFQVSVWLIAAGLATIGGSQLRSDPTPRHGVQGVWP